MEYEAVIGLEVHVQLKTASKVFSRSSQHYGAEPNTLTDPVVLGLPGALPVINLEAIKQTVRAGLIFDCEIAEECRWDRKNYFYPDSPKNYQITQQDQPICRHGRVEIELPGPARNVMGRHRSVALNRIHLEEDVGKLTHLGDRSLIDFNRAGTPLAEIVSEPDLYSADEAFAYLTALKMELESAAISDCDMEKGQMRCDANISIRPRGSDQLGTRVELKNLNSISGVRNGIAFEIRRQIETLQQGGTVSQETRRWNAMKNVSEPMRQKETANDYCYFPDPDLMPVRITKTMIEELRAGLPERPFDRQRRFMEVHGLPYTVTSVLCHSRQLSEFFEAAVAVHPNPRAIANLLINDLLRELSARNRAIDGTKMTPGGLARLVAATDEGRLSRQMAQNLIIEAFNSDQRLEDLLARVPTDDAVQADQLQAICRQVMAENGKAVDQYRSGKTNAINALKGRVMAITSGRANPVAVDKILSNLLNS